MKNHLLLRHCFVSSILRNNFGFRVCKKKLPEISSGLHLSCQNTRVGDETGIAMAEALWLNDTLRHFSWAADGTDISDASGRTLAQGVCLGQGMVKHDPTTLVRPEIGKVQNQSRSGSFLSCNCMLLVLQIFEQITFYV